MNRRHLLGMVAVTGLALVGGHQATKGSGGLGAVDVLVPIKSRDQASALIRHIEASLEEVAKAVVANHGFRDALRTQGYQVGQNPDHSIYMVNEAGSELFIPNRPAIDYKRLGEELGQALRNMPPPRIRIS